MENTILILIRQCSHAASSDLIKVDKIFYYIIPCDLVCYPTVNVFKQNKQIIIRVDYFFNLLKKKNTNTYSKILLTFLIH